MSDSSVDLLVACNIIIFSFVHLLSLVADQLPVATSYAGKPLSLSSLMPTMSAESSPSLCKYWSQRYRLFSLYDQGIQMDNGERKGSSLVCVCVCVSESVSV